MAALVAAWWLAAPGVWPGARAVVAGGAVAWYPVLYSLSLGQPALVIVLAVGAGWWLAEAGRPYLAGVVLGLSAIKPQLTLLLPARAPCGWTVARRAGVGGRRPPSWLPSLVRVIGAQGLDDYRSLLAEAQHARQQPLLHARPTCSGRGALSYVAQGDRHRRSRCWAAI